MKALTLLPLIFFPVMTSNAQTPASPQDPPDISVVKFNWSKERIGWEKDPFGGPVESFDEMRMRVGDERRLEQAKRSGNQAEVNRIERDLRADNALKTRQSKPPREAYRYKLSIRNNSAKPIKAIDWDYIFLDPETHSEIGRHQFTSEEKINPGKSRELDVVTILRPIKIINAKAQDKSDKTGFNEQVMVVRIEYSDGSVWQRN